MSNTSISSASRNLFSGKDLFRLVWPLLADQFLNTLIGMVDVLMVSSLGEKAMSGVSLVDSVNFLVFQVVFALAAGGNVVISRCVGAQDRAGAGKATSQLMTLTVSIMTLLSVVIIFARRTVFHLLFGTVEQEVFNNAMTYMWMTTLSFPVLALYNSCAAAFRSTGDTRTPLLVSMIMNLVNIVGNALGIYVLKMGVAGVALPTLFSRILGGVLLLYFLQKRNDMARISQWSDFKLTKKTTGLILSIGIPGGIENGIFQLGKVMLSSLVATLGTASIAGYAVAGNLVPYLYLPGNALGAAMLTVVGQCIGAGKQDQAKKYVWILIGANYALLLFFCSILLFGGDLLISFYHLSDQSFDFASRLLLSHTIAMIIWPFAFLTPNYYRAQGKATFTMIVALTTMWIFRVGGAYFFVQVLHKDVVWIWYAMYMDWVVRFVIYLVALLKKRRK